MRVPQFKDPEVTKFLVEWDRELQAMRKDALSAVSGNKSLLLYSPGLKVFEVTIDDAGVFHTTKVAG